jgi:acyl-CoA thioester hydrolase
MPGMSTPLSDHPIRVTLPLQWGEMDSYGHLNNVVYFRYFESARMAYFRHIGFFDNRGVGPILHSTSCRYKAPLHHPDELTVGVRTTRIEDDRFHMSMSLWSGSRAVVCAVGEAIIVAFDYDLQQKASLPVDVRGRIEALERP